MRSGNNYEISGNAPEYEFATSSKDCDGKPVTIWMHGMIYRTTGVPRLLFYAFDACRMDFRACRLALTNRAQMLKTPAQ